MSYASRHLRAFSVISCYGEFAKNKFVISVKPFGQHGDPRTRIDERVIGSVSRGLSESCGYIRHQSRSPIRFQLRQIPRPALPRLLSAGIRARRAQCSQLVRTRKFVAAAHNVPFSVLCLPLSYAKRPQRSKAPGRRDRQCRPGDEDRHRRSRGIWRYREREERGSRRARTARRTSAGRESIGEAPERHC